VLPLCTGNRATFIIINWFSQEFGDWGWGSCDILGFNYDPHFLFSGFYNDSGCVYKSQKMFRPCPLVVAILVPLWSDVPPPTIHPWSSQVICDRTYLIGDYLLGKKLPFLAIFGQKIEIWETSHQPNNHSSGKLIFVECLAWLLYLFACRIAVASSIVQHEPPLTPELFTTTTPLLGQNLGAIFRALKSQIFTWNDWQNYFWATLHCEKFWQWAYILLL